MGVQDMCVSEYGLVATEVEKGRRCVGARVRVVVVVV